MLLTITDCISNLILELMIHFEFFYILSFFIFGLCFGSFATMASHRIPLSKDMITRSHCPLCYHSLGPLDLIPLFSFIFTGGKCRYCKAKISARYPLIELSLGLIFALNYTVYGLTILTLILCAIALILMIAIVTDLEHYIIPIELQIALFITLVTYTYFKSDVNRLDNFLQMTIGLLIGYLGSLLLQKGYILLKKKEGLGGADVLLIGLAGGFLYSSGLPIFLFMSGLLGIVTHVIWQSLGKGVIFPFGPSLAISLYLCLLFSWPKKFYILFL